MGGGSEDEPLVKVKKRAMSSILVERGGAFTVSKQLTDEAIESKLGDKSGVALVGIYR